MADLENLNQILHNFRQELNTQLQTIGITGPGATVQAEHVETGEGYQVQIYAGGFKWVGISHIVVSLISGDSGG